MKHLGIMGGVFDPIHYGHLFTAEEARVEFKLDKIIFVPCRKPAHKRENNISDSEHRYLMTDLATSNNQFFKVSKVELNRPGPSYSIDTVKEFLRKYNHGVEIFFITGADAFLEIDSWYKSEELVQLCQFVAVTRPGYDLNKLNQKFKKIIKIMEIPALSISSTDIRRRVREEKSIKYLLPHEVEKYIYKKGLYRKM
ncbi:nicotinate-nucleotide adenylyltransferase [Candidatus Atribacteria bacterium 1244-E10-H5-B2]|nr:MAG: nicotinate-nucleotide adenylyltransferase [Candidatus Atribacteria bacterium 1244-E10-H5-B2]